jgi:hypothetical protein
MIRRFQYSLNLITLVRYVWMMMTSVQADQTDEKTASEDDRHPQLQDDQNFRLPQVKHREWKGKWNEMVKPELFLHREVSNGSERPS